MMHESCVAFTQMALRIQPRVIGPSGPCTATLQIEDMTSRDAALRDVWHILRGVGWGNLSLWMKVAFVTRAGG